MQELKNEKDCFEPENIGYVYILINPSLRDNFLKIGMTTRTSEERAKEVSRGTGVASEYHVAYEEKVPDCRLAERLVHKRLDKYRNVDNREFFIIPLKEAIPIVAEISKKVREDFAEREKKTIKRRKIILKESDASPQLREKQISVETDYYTSSLDDFDSRNSVEIGIFKRFQIKIKNFCFSLMGIFFYISAMFFYIGALSVTFNSDVGVTIRESLFTGGLILLFAMGLHALGRKCFAK